MDTDIPHSVEKRLQAIEEFVGMNKEEDADTDAEDSEVDSDSDDTEGSDSE